MKHKTTLPRRAAALLLALVLLLPAAYAAAGERMLQTSVPVVDGLTYYNTVTVNNDRRIESHALELAPDSPVHPILLQGSETIYTGVSINRAISNAQAAGYHVLGGINTDFFSMSNGVPLGLVIVAVLCRLLEQWGFLCNVWVDPHAHPQAPVAQPPQHSRCIPEHVLVPGKIAPLVLCHPIAVKVENLQGNASLSHAIHKTHGGFFIVIRSKRGGKPKPKGPCGRQRRPAGKSGVIA